MQLRASHVAMPTASSSHPVLRLSVHRGVGERTQFPRTTFTHADCGWRQQARLRGACGSAAAPAAGQAATADRPISLSPDALRHLRRLQEDSGGGDLLLRVGVKSGGCSGMSYTMDFEDGSNIAQDDTVIEYDEFKLVTDAMSLLYLFGMTLDYSNKLIGGGFIFQNPNAQNSCGCGKSFGV